MCFQTGAEMLSYDCEDLPLEVTRTSMDKNSDEKDRIKVGDDRGCAYNGAPGQTHRPVCYIVGLAGVRPPSTGKEAVAADHDTSASLTTQDQNHNAPMSSLNV